MHPILFKIGGFTVYTYGALLALAFYLSNRWALYLARRIGYSASAVEHSLTWCILWGVVGSRLGFVLQFPDRYLNKPLQILNLREGGLTVMGGILLTAGMQWFQFRGRSKSVLNLFDFWAGPLLVGMAFGRLGCLAQGCCFGSLTAVPWAITYPPTTLLAPRCPPGPRHPSQLYEMLADLALLGLVTRQVFRLRFAGQNFYTFMLGYGVIRFLDELSREQEGLLGPMTIYQWTCLCMIVVGASGLAGLFGKRPVDREIFPMSTPGTKSAKNGGGP